MKGTNTLENTLTLSGIKQTITPPKISPSKISLSSKNHSSLQRLGFEIIEISNSTLLTEFISIWDKKSSFAFTIHWLNSIYSNSSKPIYGNNIKHQLPLWPSFILEGISVCWGETVYYIPLMLSNLSAKASKTWNILSNIFTRDWNIKMGFDMKQTLSILLNFSTKLNGPIYDPKIAAWLLDPKDNSNECYNLEKLFSQYLPSSNISGFPENNIEMICKQTIQTWFLMNKLFDLLKLEQIEQVFLNIEMPLVSVIAEIEFWGIGFDADQCRKHLAYITQKIQDLEKEAHQLVHRPFNLNSAKEVGVILFDEIGLPSGRKIPGAKKHKFLKTDAQYDTSAQYLRTIQALHPLPGILIEYRRLQTLLEKYINILPKYLSFHTALETPRLLTNCLQTDSATGRIIFQNPNLQTIPHERIFSLSEVTISTSLRDAFIPKPGMIFLSADYSQLELCFMAHFSEDPILLNLLNTSDPLSHIASKWLKKDVMLITKTEREQCKAVTYGIFYGMGVRTISEKLNLPEDETEILLEQFKANFSKLMQFINNTVESCKTSGYIKTLYGRKRTFPEIYSKDQNEKCATERSVINTYCQGSAADVIKLAMINIHNRISEWKALQQLSMSFFNLEKEKDFPHLVLQMHDELLFEIPEPDLPIIQRIVQEEMENGFSLKVPLKVKMKCGKSWGALQSIPTKQTS